MRIANAALAVPVVLPHTRRDMRRRTVVTVGAGAVAFVLLRSMTAAVAAPVLGSPTCVRARAATTAGYITGRVCPPEGFADTLGYHPELVQTPYGWRYTKPASAGGSCSGPIAEHGPFWDFGTACRMHDYGYDLVRFGVAERSDADRLLYRDMKSSCSMVQLFERPVCKILADTANAVLTVGDVTGFDVERLTEGPVGRSGRLVQASWIA